MSKNWRPSMMSTLLKDPFERLLGNVHWKDPWKNADSLNSFWVVFLRHFTWKFNSKLQMLNETELTLMLKIYISLHFFGRFTKTSCCRSHTFVGPVQNFLNKIKLSDSRFNAQRRIQRGGQRETLLKSLFALLFAKLLCHVSHSDAFLNFVRCNNGH